MPLTAEEREARQAKVLAQYPGATIGRLRISGGVSRGEMAYALYVQGQPIHYGFTPDCPWDSAIKYIEDEECNP